ncbi:MULTISPECIES: 2-hydroxychromene-2-carboxylate isomerase [unclassified Herbaspirillum]|uniref:2-hydroxychromene-2-carboxylate isomerase n=1 Tax=unclassified Herbaspirillum TaxID=2624150 RepID=UPI001150469E|nr:MULTISPECIES: 2-hydroxychromene-2-carboxylate isomerase [unclassified Herbaspirillum]MBB5390017.1 2-hydroxychromene-2-carboxylate isomerase [Herbaspirillum sp. SJZ102]TQK09481.1 2-hydroxychromene-2-carboxylate isomerase [Herbaspirillum sp. SJZ130]TQK13832.1 2-hydroxychromene-2-carboxylate isomerase [Herbaspirillum sp. SJZ106]TWC69555.1 2-hydroxychromene-2-carboxylate isomerase [Herbaspirillum sp. SJZ099]
MSTPAIEFWFDFGSNYSYISVMRIGPEAAAAGARVVWRPFLLGPVFRALGWSTSPFVLQKEKGDYTWKDMQRQCRKYGLPWQRPSNFPRSAVPPTRIALANAEQPWIGEFCRRVMQLNFVDDRDIDHAGVVQEVLLAMGLPAQQLWEQAQSQAWRERLRAQTGMARQRGIFGAPTFFVGDEMFWGNDRLDDALAYCRP